jgi:hypothetical protein
MKRWNFSIWTGSALLVCAGLSCWAVEAASKPLVFKQLAQNNACPPGRRLCSGRFGRHCIRPTRYRCHQGYICLRPRRIFRHAGRLYCLSEVEAARMRQQVRGGAGPAAGGSQGQGARAFVKQKSYKRCRQDGDNRRYCECGVRVMEPRLTNGDIRAMIYAYKYKRKVSSNLANKLRSLESHAKRVCARYRGNTRNSGSAGGYSSGKIRKIRSIFRRSIVRSCARDGTSYVFCNCVSGRVMRRLTNADIAALVRAGKSRNYPSYLGRKMRNAGRAAALSCKHLYKKR